MGHELLSIEPWDNNESEETATVMGFNVEEREGYLWTSPMSYNWNLGYELRRADVNHPWRIYFIGNG